MQVFIRRFRNEKRTEAETHPAVVCGIVTGDSLVSDWPILFSLSVVTVPQVFAKVNSVQFVSLSFLSGKLKCTDLCHAAAIL